MIEYYKEVKMNISELYTLCRISPIILNETEEKKFNKVVQYDVIFSKAQIKQIEQYIILK